jgi:ABC-type multidrug transport system ATPase subunit
MRSDVIYVLDQGKIVESGTHEELLEHHGLYRKLFEDQNESLLQSGLLPSTSMGSNGDASHDRKRATDPDPDASLHAHAPG